MPAIVTSVTVKIIAGCVMATGAGVTGYHLVTQPEAPARVETQAATGDGAATSSVPPTTVAVEPLAREVPAVEAAALPAPPEPSVLTAPPPDTTPPDFAIQWPLDGSVHDDVEIGFEGVVEPGSRVFAGPYEADVDGEGHWRIVLQLSPGANAATLTATDPAGNSSTATVTVSLVGHEAADHETVEFAAHQEFGSCGEEEPYDVFYGTGAPGSVVVISSPYGSGDTLIGETGHWERKVFFRDAPFDTPFDVTVSSGQVTQHFSFVRVHD